MVMQDSHVLWKSNKGLQSTRAAVTSPSNDLPHILSRSNTGKSRNGSGLGQRSSTAVSVFSDTLTNDDGLQYVTGTDDERLDSRAASRRALLEPEDGRLSRCLKTWMPDYKIRTLPPQPFPPRKPVFSARLGDNIKIKRSDSSESIATQLSLLSCSSNGSRVAFTPKSKRRKRRKLTEDIVGQRNADGTSIWVQLASKSQGVLDTMMRMHAMYVQMESETEIYRALPEEERQMVTVAGQTKWITLGPGRQRSDSASNVHKKLPPKKKRQRTRSAGDKHEGPLINFMEVRRHMINQRLAALQQTFSRHRRSSRRSMGTRSLSRHSLTSVGSNEVQGGHSPTNLSPLEFEPSEKESYKVSMWKGDSQILEIDLKRELTEKVKSKIISTTTALEKATGLGDTNDPRHYTGPLEEYPMFVEEDFSQIAKIPQRIRISPSLSNVIRTDIKVRMGRPRYHEIRMNDLRIWNRGQCLDRAHRNLKVFNWLHSLQESDFDMRLPEGVDDIPPGGEVTTRDETVIAVDDPKVKPLFERIKHQYIV